MMLTASASGHEPRAYVIRSEGKDVGWLRAGLVGFRGFASEDEAREAARLAAVVLENWYRSRWQSAELVPLEGAVEPARRIHAGETLVGRLVAPDEGAAGDAATWGFELRVPSTLWVATALGLAQRIFTALREEVASAS